MRGQDDRSFNFPDRRIKAGDPCIAVGAGPTAQIDTLAIAAHALPKGLPMTGAAVVETRYGQHDRIARVAQMSESVHGLILVQLQP